MCNHIGVIHGRVSTQRLGVGRGWRPSASRGRRRARRRTGMEDKEPERVVELFMTPQDAMAGLSELFDEPEEPTWQEQALCAQTDPEAFFPEKGGSTREAKRICAGCEVRAECLEYALAQDERFGIWGGLSERERRKLKRRVV